MLVYMMDGIDWNCCYFDEGIIGGVVWDKVLLGWNYFGSKMVKEV